MTQHTSGAMQDTVVDGVGMWSRWQSERGLYFNSWLVRDAAGSFVVDPLEPDDGQILDRCRAAGVGTIVLTNRDHERAAATFARELDAQIVVPQADAALFSVPVSRAVGDGDRILGWRVIGLDGYKTPGEMVLYCERRRAAISGDAFWGAPAGSLRLMPDDKLADPQRALLSARRVRALSIDHLLVGDGMPVFGGASRALGDMLDGRAADAPVHILNLADVHWDRHHESDPPPFTADVGEIGLMLGAEKIGAALARLAPGEAYCPLHWHTREEELFIVWSGTPTLRTPAGNRRLQPGDCVVFAAAPHGAHRVSNDSQTPCTLVMLSNLDAGDVCFYPDSKKFVVERTGTLVRAEPQLDYFDGETA